MALTQVRSDGIATGAVGADQIATGAVTANDLEDSGVTAGTYGSSSAIPAITVDAKGRITSASTNSVTQVGGANGVDFNDNVKARFGTGNDLEIYHNASSSFIDNQTNHLYIRNYGDDSDVYIQTDNGSGSITNYIICDGSNGEVSLRHYGSQKLNTTSGGINVTGQVVADGLVCDSGVTLTNTDAPQLVLKDSDSSGSSARVKLEAHGSDNVVDWFIGHTATSDNSVTFRNRDNQPIYFGTNDTDRAVLNSDGHWIPATNNTYDLGTSSNRWRNVYTNDLNLSNEGGTNDVDGTWGSWTIQEGEDDLFLLNRRNGKKYKFNLTEVN